jgi:hypothetical protein
MKSLYCPQCDNAERFSVSAVEYHTWRVDGQRQYVESRNDCHDAKMGDEFQCEDCGEFVCEYEFCERGCGKPKTKCTCERTEHKTRVRVEMSLNQYAELSWCAEDVQTLRPDLTEIEAENFLSRNEKHLRDRLCELGWGVMETLLAMDEYIQGEEN